MTDYTITTDFGAKDSLPSGNAAKVIKGSEFTTEFTNIKTAVNTKADTAGDTFTGAVTFDAAVTLNADVTFDTDTMFVNVSANRVGIGTASPANTLTVGALEASASDQNGTVGIKCNANHRGIVLQENSGAEQWEIGVDANGSLKFYDSASATPTVTFADISGKVGIGTTGPIGTLDIKTTGNVGFEFFPENTTDTNLIINYDRTSDTYQNLQTRAATHQFLIGTSEKMRIDASGNVGIGTSSPSSPLHVTHNTGVKLSDSASTRHLNLTPPLADGTPAIVESTSANGLRLNASGTNAPLQLYSNNTERMRIDSSGNLLVGKTATGFGTAGIELFHDNQVYATSTTHGLAVNRLATDGDVAKFYKDGALVGSISVTGSATSYNTSSDERLKENIQDAEDAGSKIDAIQVRQFDWKSDGSHQDYGVIAQELVEVAPEAVTEGETEDDMMSVDYSKLVPTLIKEIQTLRNRVAQLENN